MKQPHTFSIHRDYAESAWQQISMTNIFVFIIVHSKKSLANRQEVRKSGFEEENSSCSHSAASQLSPLCSRGGGNTRPCTQWCCWDYRPPCWWAARQPGRRGVEKGGVPGERLKRGEVCTTSIASLIQHPNDLKAVYMTRNISVRWASILQRLYYYCVAHIVCS